MHPYGKYHEKAYSMDGYKENAYWLMYNFPANTRISDYPKQGNYCTIALSYILQK